MLKNDLHKTLDTPLRGEGDADACGTRLVFYCGDAAVFSGGQLRVFHDPNNTVLSERI